MKSFKKICREAQDFLVEVEKHPDHVKFINANGEIVSWMYQVPDGWRGYTKFPHISGNKTGRQGDVADWCLDYAVNGF